MSDTLRIKIEEAISTLSLVSRSLGAALHDIIGSKTKDYFPDLKKTIVQIDKPAIPQKPPRSEIYLLQWEQFIKSERSTLENSALRYLCWETEVVDHPKFYEYLKKNKEHISARALKGLVTTIHNNWQRNYDELPIVRFTLELLIIFTGRDRTITIWREIPKILLGPKASALFAQDILLPTLMNIKEACESWALSENSAFMRYAVVDAADQTLPQFGRQPDITEYILKDLLSWKGWGNNPEGLRSIIKRLILHPYAPNIIKELTDKILSHPQLGDPRLPANKNKWIGVDLEARQKFIGWLSRRDIVFFFDHVLKGKDLHGRREFWLRYVDRMVSSRPLLSDSAAIEFRNSKGVNYGKLISSVNKAAFILDFGRIVVVEFSNVGRIYIYRRDEFDKIITDVWTNYYIREGSLKKQSIPNERKIRHQALANIVNVDWRNNASTILAQLGVRR